MYLKNKKRKNFVSILLLLGLSGCAQPPIYIIPKIYLQDTSSFPVKTNPKNIDLSDDNIKLIKKGMTRNQLNFINRLLYNYYDNYYGLKQCNKKIEFVGDYVDYLNKIKLS